MKQLFCILLLILSANMVYSQCYMDRHSTVGEDGWISCSMTPNPNNVRGESHWIMYDLGHEYYLGQSTFWNLNAADRTNEGIKEAVVDYSIDGTNWIEWGTFSLNEAESSGIYEGENGPDFQNIKAAFVLITVLETHGGNCAGLSEIKINIGESTDVEELAEIGILGISINPNPADQFAEINFDSKNALVGIINITDNTGRLIQKQDVTIRQGQNQIRLNTSDLLSGQYFVTLLSEDKSSTIKLSVIHSN